MGKWSGTQARIDRDNLDDGDRGLMKRKYCSHFHKDEGMRVERRLVGRLVYTHVYVLGRRLIYWPVRYRSESVAVDQEIVR